MHPKPIYVDIASNIWYTGTPISDGIYEVANAGTYNRVFLKWKDSKAYTPYYNPRQAYLSETMEITGYWASSNNVWRKVFDLDFDIPSKEYTNPFYGLASGKRLNDNQFLAVVPLIFPPEKIFQLEEYGTISTEEPKKKYSWTIKRGQLEYVNN